jgi:glycosyltransferase involved in cell wall biosynthesis
MRNKKLHIAFLDFDDLRNELLSGGQARATYEVAYRLVNLGHLVTIICSRYPGSVDYIKDGIYYKHIGLGSSNIKLNNAAYIAALPFTVNNFKCDVMIECFTAPISTLFSPVFTKTPVIGMPTMFEAKEFSKKYHLPFHWIEAIGAKQYKYFLAYSILNKKKMEKLNPNIHTRIIPNGVSEKSFTVKASEKPFAFFIGRIDIRQKSLDTLIDACALLPKNFPIKIVIAGNGPKEDEQALKKMIKQKGVSSFVEFIGRVDGKKKEQLLANCMFGVYPSRFEDFPLVPLEFAGMGKPIVCMDVDGLAWVTKDVALKAQPGDAKSLAEALLTMTIDKHTRAKLKKNARPFAKQYGWNTIAKQYADYAREVIALDKAAVKAQSAIGGSASGRKGALALAK